MILNQNLLRIITGVLVSLICLWFAFHKTPNPTTVLHRQSQALRKSDTCAFMVTGHYYSGNLFPLFWASQT
jgi:hypothetical protein